MTPFGDNQNAEIAIVKRVRPSIWAEITLGKPTPVIPENWWRTAIKKS